MSSPTPTADAPVEAAVDTTADAATATTTTTAPDPAEPSAEESPKITRHVAVCAFPFGAHSASLLQLVRRIAASAPPDVSVVFSFFSTAASNAKLFSSGVPDNIRPRTVVIPEGDGGEAGQKEVDRFIEAAPEALKVSVADAEEEVGVEIGCVVADAFIWFSRAIAEEKNVPWVPFWTASPAALSALISTDLFRTKFGTEGIQGKEKESADLIPGFSSVLAEDLPHGVISGDLNSPGSQMLYNVGVNVPKATAVSINSFQELDPMITHDLSSKLPSLLNVGPFPLISPTASSDSEDDNDDEHACITWLDAHKDRPSSVAYVSFGTITTPSKDDIAALAEALESNGAPFLWSIRKEVQTLLPEGFLERVTGEAGNYKIVPWAPQMKVLGHPSVGVFVTHCGWNSVIESVTTGVPMVCVPIMYDQALNSRFVESVWKVGVRVERGDDNTLTKEAVEKAIKRVLSNDEEEGKAIRESAGAMKEKAEEAAKGPNGSSFKDSERIVEIVMGLSPKDKKKDKDSRSWKKWFKVFRVWKR